MGMIVGLVFFLISALAMPSSRTVVARPEAANVVRVGQTLVIPLYDGKIVSLRTGHSGLRRLGYVRIARRDLRRDLGGRVSGVVDASSDRGEAFRVERPGDGTINVTLRLSRLEEPCSSCRTVHFFYRAG